MDEKEKDEKASTTTTSASYHSQSRRSQPGVKSETFKAQGGQTMEPVSFESFLAAREAGKDPFAGQPKLKSRNTEYVKAAKERGYVDEDAINLQADIDLMYRDFVGKTTISHGGV
jgi:hypothetical protein